MVWVENAKWIISQGGENAKWKVFQARENAKQQEEPVAYAGGKGGTPPPPKGKKRKEREKGREKRIKQQKTVIRKFNKIHAFYIDIFQNKMLNINFEKILLKSIQNISC